MDNKVMFWDFDGTLAYWHWMFSNSLLKVLNECEKGHGICVEDISQWLNEGFPWHEPEKDHSHLTKMKNEV